MTSNHSHKSAIRALMAAENLTYTAAREKLAQRAGQTDPTFIEAILSGDALLDEIDDWMERWHDGDQKKTLDQHLGFTESEGAMWAENPASLRLIAFARRLGIPATKVAETFEHFHSHLPLSAEDRGRFFVESKEESEFKKINEMGISYPGISADSTKVIFGANVNGQAVWDTSLDQHLIVSGEVGCGSPALTLSILDHCWKHPDEWETVVIDNYGEMEYYQYTIEGKPYSIVPNALTDAWVKLNTIVERINDKNMSPKRTLLVLDKFTEMVNNAINESRKSKSAAKLMGKQCYELLDTIIANASAHNIHLVSTQYQPSQMKTLESLVGKKDVGMISFHSKRNDGLSTFEQENQNLLSVLPAEFCFMNSNQYQGIIKVYTPPIIHLDPIIQK